MLLDKQSLAFYILVAAIVVLLIWIAFLHLKIRRLLAGRNAKSLEEVIIRLGESVRRTDSINEAIREHLVKMEERLRRSIQHVKTIRFNPFREQGQGSNQSFAAAFLDEDGNGAVISSLYARDKVSIYAKPIANRRSEYELTAEEEASLQ